MYSAAPVYSVITSQQTDTHSHSQLFTMHIHRVFTI